MLHTNFKYSDSIMDKHINSSVVTSNYSINPCGHSNANPVRVDWLQRCVATAAVTLLHFLALSNLKT